MTWQAQTQKQERKLHYKDYELRVSGLGLGTSEEVPGNAFIQRAAWRNLIALRLREFGLEVASAAIIWKLLRSGGPQICRGGMKIIGLPLQDSAGIMLIDSHLCALRHLLPDELSRGLPRARFKYFAFKCLTHGTFNVVRSETCHRRSISLGQSGKCVGSFEKIIWM